VDRVVINQFKHKYRSTVIDSVYFSGDQKISEVRYDETERTIERHYYSDSVELNLIYNEFSDLRQASFTDKTKKEYPPAQARPKVRKLFACLRA
jgi:hypothetical protein